VTPVVRDASPADRDAVDAFHDAAWAGPLAAAHGRLYDLRTVPTLVAMAPELVGVLTYEVVGDALEVVSIAARPARSGAGSALLAAAVDRARAAGLRRVWLVTTNDNVDALRFYQRRGMRIAAVDPGAVDRSRAALKPAIPVVGAYGIPMHDELTLVLTLDG